MKKPIKKETKKEGKFNYLAEKGGTMWASQEYLYPTTEVNDGENKQAT